MWSLRIEFVDKTMDIQSWSAFDQRQAKEKNNVVCSSSSSSLQHHNKVDSLYVSASSENVAPTAVALLRQAGLTSSSVDSRSSLSSRNKADNNNNDLESEEEFRLRFYWMRPHPSLVFSLGEEMAENKEQDCQTLKNNNHDTQTKLSETCHHRQQQKHPAVIAAKMMHAYRGAQLMKQQEHEKQMEDEESGVIPMEEESNHSQSDNMKIAEGSCIAKSTTILPFELPTLRVDMASLVEPPLMTSWLPSAEGIDTSYY